MMSAAKSRASGSSVGKNSTVQIQSLSSCQYGSKSSLRFVLKIDLPVFRLHLPKLAVQGRCNQNWFLGVSSRSLQGIAERPLPCNYNVIQFVCALSRRKPPPGTPIQWLAGEPSTPCLTRRLEIMGSVNIDD